MESTYYVTVGIEVSQWLLPVAKGSHISAAYLRTVASRSTTERPPVAAASSAPALFVAGVQSARGLVPRAERHGRRCWPTCRWEPRELTFPGRAGTALDGRDRHHGGPHRVVPTTP
ncbi:hypothetical protein GCM10020220_014120 [Nonomuraea rubra]